MKPKNSASWAYGLVTFCGCATCATIGHYAEVWSIAYFVGLGVAMFGGLSIFLMVGD